MAAETGKADATVEAAGAKVLHGAPLAMAALEGPTHIMRDVNAAFCRLVHQDRHVLLGRPFAGLDPPGGEDQECIALLDRVYSTHESETLADQPRSKAPGADLAYWSYSAWAVPSDGGSVEPQPVGVIVQVTDTTEDYNFRQMAAQTIQKLIVTSVRLHEKTELLEQADTAKDDFLAMLGHELRNPLNAIGNAAKLIEMQTSGQDKVQKSVTIMLRQVRHSARLVDDLLDVSRVTHGKLELRKERVDLSVAARRAADVIQPQMDLSECTFSISTPAQPIWLDGDSARLEQIFDNLLNNAAKYTEPGGSVSLSVRREKDEAVIEVSDTGAGIGPEMLPRIFDLFFQEDRSLARSQGGLGIGLTLVKTLAELHGGTVGVKSAGPGLGSVFTVRLPVSPERGASRQTRAGGAGAALRSYRVLLVEDNVGAALPLADILELWGHTVRIAHDGPAAIAAAQRDVPDIVLLDLGLPGMNGYEVAHILRTTEGMEHVRLVAVTGYGSEDDRHRTRETGFNHHLVKPLDFAELQTVLSTGPV